MERGSNLIASLSLILPVFNSERVLAARVNELLDLATDIHAPFELWIYDDGSTDQTLEVAQGLVGEYPQIKIGHFQRRQGWTKVVRQAISQSRGDLIMICDPAQPVSTADFASLWQLRDDRELVLARSQAAGGARRAGSADRLIQQMLQSDSARLADLPPLPSGITLIRRASWLEIAPARAACSTPVAPSKPEPRTAPSLAAAPPVIDRITRTDLRDRGVPAPLTGRGHAIPFSGLVDADSSGAAAYYG